MLDKKILDNLKKAKELRRKSDHSTKLFGISQSVVDKVIELIQHGYSWRYISKKLRVSNYTIYRIVKLYGITKQFYRVKVCHRGKGNYIITIPSRIVRKYNITTDDILIWKCVEKDGEVVFILRLERGEQNGEHSKNL